jgi:hypothetical protein
LADKFKVNPNVARALVEVLKAKQKQIAVSLKRDQITSEEFERLKGNLETVRKQLSNSTSANTQSQAQNFYKHRKEKRLR